MKDVQVFEGDGENHFVPPLAAVQAAVDVLLDVVDAISPDLHQGQKQNLIFTSQRLCQRYADWEAGFDTADGMQNAAREIREFVRILGGYRTVFGIAAPVVANALWDIERFTPELTRELA